MWTHSYLALQNMQPLISLLQNRNTNQKKQATAAWPWTPTEPKGSRFALALSKAPDFILST